MQLFYAMQRSIYTSGSQTGCMKHFQWVCGNLLIWSLA